ncbi:DUF6113 family protein [Oerskovia turbata]
MDTVKKTGIRTIGRALLCVLLGLVVGTVGTVMHRVVVTDHLLPVGIVVALLAVLSAAILSRAWTGFAGVVGFAVGWVVAVQVLASKGPGGDLLVPNQTVGLAWVYGGMIAIVIVAFLPSSWFSDRPVRPRALAPREP